MSDGITKISAKVIEKEMKNQTSDFKHATNAYFHRNQYVPQMQYFDDTYVSTFEVCLSLEFQMAYKSDDISFYLFVIVILIKPQSIFKREVSCVYLRVS